MILYDRSGGYERLLAMTTRFYDAATRDPVLGSMFTAAASDHARYLASWMRASFGGPRTYLEQRGDLRFVIWQHAGMKFTEEQRARWATLMFAAAEQTGMSEDFMRHFRHYVETITRSVREQSHMELPAMRAMLGIRPGGTIEPIS